MVKQTIGFNWGPSGAHLPCHPAPQPSALLAACPAPARRAHLLLTGVLPAPPRLPAWLMQSELLARLLTCLLRHLPIAPAGTSCSTWTGVRLCDLLRLCGIYTMDQGAQFVCFRGPKGALTWHGLCLSCGRPDSQASCSRAMTAPTTHSLTAPILSLPTLLSHPARRAAQG